MLFFSTGSHCRRFPALWPELTLWLVNTAAVFFVTHYLLEINSQGLFYGFDGQSILAFVSERHRFSGTMFGLGNDPVIGLGNISYSLNPIWFPSFLLSTTASGEVNAPLAYAIGATELFTATLLCGRLNGFAIAPSTAASWLLTLMTWPLSGWPEVVTHWFLTPSHAEALVASTIMASAALHLGVDSIRRSIFMTGVIFLCLTYVLLAIPVSLILIAPVTGMFAVANLLLSGRRERLIIMLCWAGIGLIALILGHIHYLAGLLRYNESALFPELSKRALTLYGGRVSLFLWTPISSFSATHIFSPERIMVGGGFIGSIFTMLHRRGQHRGRQQYRCVCQFGGWSVIHSDHGRPYCCREQQHRHFNERHSGRSPARQFDGDL
jgi:hypothetical protein